MKQQSISHIDESQILVEILCLNRWRNEWLEHIDINKLIDLAMKNKVLSTLAHYIFEMGIEDQFKGTEASRRFKEALLLNERDKIAYKKVLKKVIQHFSQEGIDVCLLKGLSLDGDTPRDMGDLDLLIYEEDLHKAIDTLEGMGFVYVGDKRNRYMRKSELRQWEKLITWSNQFEFLDEKTGVLIELHTNLFERRRVYRFSLDSLLDSIDSFWERAVWSDELECKVFSTEDVFWLLALHTSIKRTAAIDFFALRTIIDMKNILIAHNPDLESLFKRAKETGTLVFLIFSLEMTERFFPETELTDIIRDGRKLLNRSKKFLISIQHNCFYNLKTINLFYTFLYRLFTPLILKSSFRDIISSLLLIPVIFQPKWRLRQIYLMPEKSHLVLLAYLLEPFRWIKIILRKKKTSSTIFPYQLNTNNKES